jgi:hypothetical protein
MLWYVLMALAGLCFLFAGCNISAPRVNFVGLGLFFMTVAVFTRG